MDLHTNVLERPKRSYIPESFTITHWDSLKPYFEDLLNREVDSLESLKKWFADNSELGAIISEDAGWRYINMTRYTENKEYAEAYQYFVQEIQPPMAPYSDKLNRKINDNPFLKELETEAGFDIMIREMRKDIEIFREENIPLSTEVQTETQKYGQISGAMSVTIDEKEMTLQQAGVLLQSIDRSKREAVYHTIAKRRLEDKQKLDDLFDKLINLRTQIAKNADFGSYRDYMFKSMGRFDYTPEDCFAFHESVKAEVVPLLEGLAEDRKSKLQIEKLRPWDKAVDPENKAPLKPFDGGEDLTDKTIECFKRLDPFLGQCLGIMKEMGHLDLESR
ncbi:MAG: M3 family metallopeptidase, partial [Bacteroidota bacterium]